MNYGMYLAATGALTNIYRQGVLANNLANANTVGYKPDVVYTRLRLPERLESGGGGDPQQMLEQLGGGHLLSPTRLDLTQGSLIDTDNDFDVAIDGEGFFVVSSTGSAEDLRLTRDGRFSLGAGGELLMTSTGMKLLDIDNKPIVLDRTAALQVRSNGDLVQNGQVRATLRLAAPVDQQQLSKLGNNLLTVGSTDPQSLRPADGNIVQGRVEASSVNPVMMLNAMIGASKFAAANLKMMQYHDHIIGQAINKLGRVA